VAFSEDYCVATPAHATITSVCPASFTTAPVDNIAATALSEANYVNQFIAMLNNNADAAGAAALVVIDDLYNYQAPQLPAVLYNAPAWHYPPVHGVDPASMRTAPSPDAVDAVAWTPTLLNEVAPAGNAITAPAISLPDVPVAPIIGAVGAAPNAPGEYVPDTPTAPGFVSPDQEIGDANAPYLAPVTIGTPELIVIDPLDLFIDYTAIQEAIDRLSSISVVGDDIPEYTVLIPEVFDVIGGMLSGTAIDTDQVSTDVLPIRHVSLSLARRGLTVPDAVIAYDAWFDTYMQDYIAASATLFDAEYRDSVVQSAYAVATQAEKVLLEINLGIHDARFKYAMERARASLQVSKGLVASYNAQIAMFEGHVLEYNAQLLELTALAQIVDIEVEMVDAIARTNKLLAREFSIEEEAKKVQVQVLKSQVEAEAAKLEAHRAVVSSYEAEVVSAQSAMLAYTGTVEAYTAEVQGAENEYDLYAAKARGISATNDMTRTQVRGDAANFRAIAAEAGALAASAGVEAIQKMRIAKSDEAVHQDNSATNSLAKYDVATKLAEFSEQVAALRSDTSKDSVRPQASADVGDAIARFTRTALDSAGRAATAAQSANESLSRAYARAYEAAGRAGASVASGKLSGFRASASINAAGALDARQGFSSRDAYSGSLSYSESDTASESISA